MNSLGIQERPCRNNREIDKIMKGMKDCNIYTLSTFEISKENLQQAKARNIIFVGLAGAYWKTRTLPVATAKIKREENIAEIRIDKDTKLPVDLNKIAEQIAMRFSVPAGVFETELSKTAQQIKMGADREIQKYDREILGRWI